MSAKAKRANDKSMRGQEIPSRIVEVCGSFGFKLNCDLHGGPRFESRDFFKSAKAFCLDTKMEEKSEMLDEFCKKQVLKAVNQYLKEGKWI